MNDNVEETLVEETKVEEKKIEPVDKNEPLYSKKLEAISREDKEYKEVKEKASELESIIKDTSNINYNMLRYLDNANHPRSTEYKTILQDIKKADYSVKEENAHMTFLATKLALSQEEVPTSLKADYESVVNSNNLTPSIKDSLNKIKPFTESAMERLNRESQRSKLVDKFGNTKTVDSKDLTEVIRDYDHGRITAEQFDKKKKEFLAANELKIASLDGHYKCLSGKR